MNQSSSASSFIAYIPVIGWLYAYLLQRQNPVVMFHLRQSVGLVIFLIATFVVWAVVAYVLAIIPYMAVFSVALFTIVIAFYLFGFVALIMGMVNALRSKNNPLPLFGQWANRLPIA